MGKESSNFVSCPAVTELPIKLITNFSFFPKAAFKTLCWYFSYNNDIDIWLHWQQNHYYREISLTLRTSHAVRVIAALFKKLEYSSNFHFDCIPFSISSIFNFEDFTLVTKDVMSCSARIINTNKQYRDPKKMTRSHKIMFWSSQNNNNTEMKQRVKSPKLPTIRQMYYACIRSYYHVTIVITRYIYKHKTWKVN